MPQKSDNKLVKRIQSLSTPSIDLFQHNKQFQFVFFIKGIIEGVVPIGRKVRIEQSLPIAQCRSGIGIDYRSSIIQSFDHLIFYCLQYLPPYREAEKKAKLGVKFVEETIAERRISFDPLNPASDYISSFLMDYWKNPDQKPYDIKQQGNKCWPL